jgi:hypothetical protein
MIKRAFFMLNLLSLPMTIAAEQAVNVGEPVVVKVEVKNEISRAYYKLDESPFFTGFNVWLSDSDQ